MIDKPKKRQSEAGQHHDALRDWEDEGGPLAPARTIKKPRRPRDVIGNAVRVMQIATGEAEEEFEAGPEKNRAAADLGRKGGKARA